VGLGWMRPRSRLWTLRRSSTCASCDLPVRIEGTLPARRIYRLLGLSGDARLDYRLSETGRFYLLEANPNPQIARKEGFADSAKHAGLPYEDLLQKLPTPGLSYTPRR
ncbi:MAG: hypothetical protein ACREC6_15275, partial [Hyphomicrobiaceae bacterium]